MIISQRVRTAYSDTSPAARTNALLPNLFLKLLKRLRGELNQIIFLHKIAPLADLYKCPSESAFPGWPAMETHFLLEHEVITALIANIILIDIRSLSTTC